MDSESEPKDWAIVYVDGIMYMKKPLVVANGKVSVRGSYYGSSTRIGSAGEVYNGEKTPQYPDKEIRIEENYSNGEKKLIFEGKFNITDYCIGITSAKKSCYPSENQDFIDEQITQICEGTFCPIDDFSPHFVLDTDLNLHLRFRFLHRFGNIAEISSVEYCKN
jgi:hypothetical protein